MFQSRNTRFCISYAWVISKIMFNETLKYFCIFGNTRPASWVTHLTSFLHVIPLRNIVPFSNIVNMSNISCLFWVERILLAVYSLTVLQKLRGRKIKGDIWKYLSTKDLQIQNEGRYKSIYQEICRSSRLQMFSKKGEGVLESFAKFLGSYLCWNRPTDLQIY